MDYYNANGLPPVPGQSQREGTSAAPSQAESTLISVPQVEPTQTAQSAFANVPQVESASTYGNAGSTAAQPRVQQNYGNAYARNAYAQPQTQAQPQPQAQAAQHYAHPAQTSYARSAAAPQQKASGSKGGSLVMGIVGGLVGAVGLILVLTLTGVIGFKGSTPQKATSTQQSSPIQISADSEDITVAAAVAAKATPSVVAVYCTYGDAAGMGSGVILDTDGNILTNYHVIEDATEISVTISGKSYDATVVGTDSSSDLAVIHAELGSDVVIPMEIGNSDALVVGDWVMTVGSPFGLEQSCSQGIVSSLYRNELMTSSTGNTIYANLIQVDAAINPGNSGGALVNAEGQLVGICTLYSSDTQSFAGIGFAIPGNYAYEIAQMIISGEKVTHAYIGVSMQTVTEQNAKSNNLAVDSGAYVAEVMEDGPAEAAGIQVGDVIVKLGDEDITSADGVIVAVRSHKIGETVKVVVMRGDEELTFDVTLADDTALQERQEAERQNNENNDNYDNKQYDYDYNYDNNGENYNFDDFLEELFDMMGDGYGNGNGNGRNNGYPFGN